MAAMIGKDRNEVIARWGLPAAVLDGKNGDKLMVYSNTRVEASGGALSRARWQKHSL